MFSIRRPRNAIPISDLPLKEADITVPSGSAGCLSVSSIETIRPVVDLPLVRARGVGDAELVGSEILTWFRPFNSLDQSQGWKLAAGSTPSGMPYRAHRQSTTAPRTI
jgi:hypothetical protein